MNKNLFLTTFFALIISSCQMKDKVDLILYNAEVYTVDSMFSKCNAVSVKNGLIVATGSDDEILNSYRADKYIDLKGKYLYPGFNDAHCHFISLGEGMLKCDLRGATSFDEIVERLRNFRTNNLTSFIIGEGWDQNLWHSKSFPSNEKLDIFFPDIPVVLTRIDFHAVIANSAAIKMAGLIPGDPSIPQREALIRNGKFTGLFLENTADRIKNALPKLSGSVLENVILAAEGECFKNGLTSVSDAEEELSRILVMDSLYSLSKLRIRSDVWLTANDENLNYFKKPYQKERFRVGTLKLYVDGALGSRGALLKSPYSDDSSTSGIRVTSEENLKEYCKWAFERGFQVATHCIGDLANQEALGIYGSILKGENDRRWRIEHAQVVDPEDIGLFRKYSVIPSVQPTHATSDMLWAVDRLGERIKYAYAYKSLLSQLGWLPSGTDFPIEKVNPIATFFSAVYRQNADFKPDEGFQMENALSKEEAIRSMTIWPAKATFEERVKGSIEKGKYADFVLLDRDLMTVIKKEVLSTKVIMTIIGGEVVYSLLP
ncbi:MAG TPA: amidohydrolase [Rikenellaceae bacterium]|nr:amidohydrolase [Rikenellaceae bacterium]